MSQLGDVVLGYDNIDSVVGGQSSDASMMELIRGDTLDQPPIEGIATSQLCRACRLAPPSFARAELTLSNTNPPPERESPATSNRMRLIGYLYFKGLY